MRILSVPVAMLLSCFLYLSFPKLSSFFQNGVRWLFSHWQSLFARKQKRVDTTLVLILFLLIGFSLCLILSLLHPALYVLLMIPSWNGFSAWPICIQCKLDLDSGAYASRTADYESLVRQAILSLLPSFVQSLVPAVLFCTIGTPIYLGASLSLLYFMLSCLSEHSPKATAICQTLHHLSDHLLCLSLQLSAGLVGRSLFLVRGHNSAERLLFLLGISGEYTDEHAPLSGDIIQAIFLCSFSCVFFMLILMIPLLPLCF